MRLHTIECQLSPHASQKTGNTPQPEESVVPILSMTVPPAVVSSATTLTTPTSVASSTTPSLPPQPQYNFHDINASSFTGLAQHIIINDQVRPDSKNGI